MNNRIAYLDSAKGFAILLVVFAHTIAWNLPDWESVLVYSPEQTVNVKITALLWQIIYAFHMPLFFMVSGYFNYKAADNEASRNLLGSVKHKTIALLLPYFTTGFLMLLLKGYYGYWFFLSLWELSILATIMNFVDANCKTGWIADIIIIAFIYISFRVLQKFVPGNIYSVEYLKFNNYLIPFFFGYMMRKYQAFESFTKGKFSWYLIIFIVFFVARYCTFLPALCYLMLIKSAAYILPIVGSLLVIEFFRTGVNVKVDRILNTIGQNTMDIYIFHLFFVIQIAAVGSFWLSANIPTCITTQIVYASIVTSIAIVLSLVVAAIFRKSKLCSLLLFGKK